MNSFYNQPAVTNNRAKLIAGACVALFLFLGIVFISIRLGGANAEVIVVGKDAKILVDGKSAKGNKLKLKPGLHRIEAQAEGFETASKNIKINKESVKITLILSPISEEANAWAKDHREEYLNAEAEAGNQTRQEGEDFFAANPLAQHLPIRTDYYAIDYTNDEANEVHVQISSTGPIGRQVALEEIRSLGFDPADYHIEFLEFANPFSKEGDLH